MKKRYESPRMNFEEIRLFERIADVCWGTAGIWLDSNGDHSITDGVDIEISTGGGCKGNWSADALNSEIAMFNDARNAYESDNNASHFSHWPALAEWLLTNPDAHLNVITAHAESHWANTKESSGGGIIIVKS